MKHTKMEHANLLDVSHSIVALARPILAMPGLRRLKSSLLSCNPVTASAVMALVVALGVLLFGFPLIAGAQGPMGTAFTYQGRLQQNGQYVNGVTCDFQFSLYTTPGTGTPPSGGTQLGPTLPLSAAVTNGYFTVDLNFGAVFSGTARYLQVEVHCPTGPSGFTPMGQRISLNPVPYAMYADNVGSAASVDWSRVISKPAGFADNFDNDLLASMVCNANNTVRYYNGQWQCYPIVTLHGQLGGLDADDHPQYLPRNGSRGMTNDLDLGGNKIVNLAAAQSPGDAVRYEQAVLDNDPAGGDLGGTYPNPRVVQLYGNPMTNTVPTTGQVLGWDGAQWKPVPNYPTGPAGNDLRGNYPNPIVQRLQTYPISTQAPLDKQVLTWNAGMSQWEPAEVSVSGVAGGDLASTYPNPIVDGLQNRPVASTQPNSGQVLGWNGSTWTPVNQSAGGAASGDLSGNYPNPTVSGLQNRSVANTAPATGQVLGWNGSTWTPVNENTSPTGTAGGDLAGTYPNPTVDGLQGRSVANTAPTAGQVLAWNGSTSAWTPATDNNYPAGPAGGDLTGTYPNPQIADNAVDSAKIADGSITSSDIHANAVGMSALDHANLIGTFSPPPERTISGGGEKYIFSSASFTPSANGRCLVIVDAIITTPGAGNDPTHPYIQTARRRNGSVYDTDSWGRRYFSNVADNDGRTASATASYVWDVYSGENTTFGCWFGNVNNNWDDDEMVTCHVSYICM
jgi:hypothetical protein